MTYSIDILRSAQKQLGQINRQDQSRIISAIQALGDDPRPQGYRKLSGRPAWRIRIGSYRVIYEIHDSQLLVLIVAVGHRREIYR
ncbi:MAG: type II toxin-antitoxin system RelE/ParE family toxin [Phycisphaerae bacterium]|nr:type II toxin-antitoxin system RelE/ParE family toxin [Phycisphaerae bacterium]